MAKEKARGISFDEYVATRSVALQRFAFLVTGDLEDAQDAVQEALLGAYPRWNSVVSWGDPTAYLKRSIVNSHISRWRKFGREAVSVEAEWADKPAPDQFQAVLDRDEAARLFEGLPLKQRVAIVMRCYEGADYADIAEVCRCSKSNARTLVARALAALRAKLTQGAHDD
jgi:RNA polymerase sigma factor (sigma-70 family)